MDKEKSIGRIEGAAVLVMALDRAIRCGNDNKESIYNDRGITVLLSLFDFSIIYYLE